VESRKSETENLRTIKFREVVMGEVFSALFGGKPKEPDLIKQKPSIEQIQQGDIEKEKVLNQFVKRKRATLLNQLTQANIKTQRLGPG